MIIGERLKGYLKRHGISAKQLAEMIGVSEGMVYKYYKMDSVDSDIISKWAEALHVPLMLFLDQEYYNNITEGKEPIHLTNVGDQAEKPGEKTLIPFYDDVSSIGGTNAQIANQSGVSQPSEYIDAGDWFKDATAAIRHYGDSMTEYPPGCILALREVQERQLIVWGRDYVIETNEYRITKRIQSGKTEEFIRAYSSNTETYPDGQLIHEPLDIAWNDIRRIYLVLGYVVKKNGGTIVFNNQK